MRVHRSDRGQDWAASWRALARFDVRHQVGSVECPVLVLSGKQDKSATPDMMVETERAYKHAAPCAIEPGTHMAVMEQPEAVAEQLEAFRARCDGRNA